MLLSLPWPHQEFITGLPTSILISFQLTLTTGREAQDCLYESPAKTCQCPYSAFRVRDRISIIFPGSCVTWPLYVWREPHSSFSWSLGCSIVSPLSVPRTSHGRLAPHLSTSDINLVSPLALRSAFTPPGTLALEDQPRSRLSISCSRSILYSSYHWNSD